MDSKTLEHDYARAQWGSVRPMASDGLYRDDLRRSDRIERAVNAFAFGLGMGIALLIMGVWP